MNTPTIYIRLDTKVQGAVDIYVANPYTTDRVWDEYIARTKPYGDHEIIVTLLSGDGSASATIITDNVQDNVEALIRLNAQLAAYRIAEKYGKLAEVPF